MQMKPQHIIESLLATTGINHLLVEMKNNISLENKTIFVTGSPGFIGAHLVLALMRLLKSAHIISFDNMNDYYDPALKNYRLKKIEEQKATSTVTHTFIRGKLQDYEAVKEVFEQYHPDVVINLAAQAGVRYSIKNPKAYIESNIIGFYNIIEACRRYPVEHLVFASSSSVYGGNAKIPFSVEDKVDHPVSLYAATKKSDELLAYSYSKLYNIPSTALRFFTVYGPAGRPDMFYYSATKKLIAGEKIQIFNYGNCKRDFTYIDDIIEGLIRVLQYPPAIEHCEDGTTQPPYAIYNIGGGTPQSILEFIKILQEELVNADLLPSDYDFEGKRELVGMQPGDVPITYADSSDLERDFGFTPRIDLRTGLRAFVEWYKEFYHL